MGEANTEIGSRQIRPRTIRPFDQTEPAIGKVFVQTRIKEFLWNIEPIEIKVI